VTEKWPPIGTGEGTAHTARLVQCGLNLRDWSEPENFEDQEAHDRFALSTIIFMLLNRGIHPFQGLMSFDIPGSETTAGKIKNNLYPYGGGKGTPHQDSLYPFWSKEMKGLFDRAFSTTTARPSAQEWLEYLNELLGRK
jgi:DNA-binding helix-hairpin-helix protein with protein kinase domain